MEEPDRQISVETLYRKWAAIREGDYGALVDMRGKARKGMSKMPEAIERVFLSLFLDESQLPVPRCIALTEEWAQQNMPEAMPCRGIILSTAKQRLCLTRSWFCAVWARKIL